ncbi:MAG TPA: hypothetical protein VKP12_00345 [Kiloniellaceae bacterium]|nr:hypothetical protein [Kiloniellaceae bacterium]
MPKHSTHTGRKLWSRLAAGLLGLGLAGTVAAAEPPVLARSAAPHTLSGEGGRELIVEGPFDLDWRSAGGRFSVEATAEGADRPAAASATQGKGQGRLRLRGEQRYRLAIEADGAWTLTITW